MLGVAYMKNLGTRAYWALVEKLGPQIDTTNTGRVTQTQLARAAVEALSDDGYTAKIDRTTLSHWKSGDSGPDDEDATRIAALTGHSRSWFSDPTELDPPGIARLAAANFKKRWVDISSLLGDDSRHMSTKTRTVGQVACIPWAGTRERIGRLVLSDLLGPDLLMNDVAIFEDRRIKHGCVVLASTPEAEVIAIYDEKSDPPSLRTGRTEGRLLNPEDWRIDGVCMEIVRGFDTFHPIHFRHLHGMTIKDFKKLPKITT